MEYHCTKIYICKYSILSNISDFKGYLCKNKKKFAIIPIFLFDTCKITQQIKVFEYGTEYKGVLHTCQEDEGVKT